MTDASNPNYTQTLVQIDELKLIFEKLEKNIKRKLKKEEREKRK
jgi:hypothetical protein